MTMPKATPPRARPDPWAGEPGPSAAHRIDRTRLRRSNAPIFWSLFGAGGSLAALIGPALVFVTGLAVPLALLLPAGTFTHERMLAFARHPLGKLFAFAVIALFAWHAVHRIYKSLHDVGIPPGTAAKLVCYGTAAVVTLVAAWALLTLGW